MPGLKVAVVMGGPGAEREVSIESGTCVMRALAALGHDVRSLDFDNRFVDALREISPDVVFNALHGVGGEDGTIQGVLEWLGIPYTGSGIAACAVALDKHLTKKLLAAEGLPTPAWDVFDLTGGTLPLLPGSLNLPLVVKPRASSPADRAPVSSSSVPMRPGRSRSSRPPNARRRSWPKNSLPGASSRAAY